MNYLPLIRKYPHFLAYGFIHYFFSSLGQTFLISLFVPHFNDAFSFNNYGFGIIYSIASLTSAFTLPYLGSIIDKIKLRKFSIINSIGLSFFALLASVASNYILLFIALFGLRMTGQGLMIMAGSTSITRYFDQNRGKAISLASIGLPLGEGIMPLVVTAMIAGMGWHFTWQILGITVLLVFIPLAYSLVKGKSPFQTVKKLKAVRNEQNIPQTAPLKNVGSKKEVLRDPLFYLIAGVFMFIPFFITGMFINQNLLVQAKGWDMEWMATCFLGFGAAKITSNLISGPLIDKFTARKVFAFHQVPLFFGVLILSASNHPMACLFYLIFAGITVSVGSISQVSVWAEIYGIELLGSIKGMVSTMVAISAALAPVVFSWALHNALFTTVTLWVLTGVLAVLNSISIIALYRAEATESKLSPA